MDLSGTDIHGRAWLLAVLRPVVLRLQDLSDQKEGGKGSEPEAAIVIGMCYYMLNQDSLRQVFWKAILELALFAMAFH